jgi:hypothetical protein
VCAALEAANPDVVGVESPPEWFSAGRYHEVTYEAQGITVPFARARKLPVVGIDWQDLRAREKQEADLEAQRVEGIRAQLAAGRPLPLVMYGRLADAQLRETARFFRSPEFDFALVNGVGSDAHARAMLAGADVASPGFGGRRNREIAARCAEAMAAHPGKRLVVVIGAGHKVVLDALFAQMPGVRVLRWGADVKAPSPEAVEDAWTKDDLLAVLGHNLDGERSYFHPDLVDVLRMRDILRRLAECGGARHESAYFEARLEMAEASLATEVATRDERMFKAAKLLRALAATGLDGAPYPFPMDHWRMRYSFAEAVRLEAARLALARADRGAAEAALEPLTRERGSGEATAVPSADLLAREFPRTLLASPR